MVLEDELAMGFLRLASAVARNKKFPMILSVLELGDSVGVQLMVMSNLLSVTSIVTVNCSLLTVLIWLAGYFI